MTRKQRGKQPPFARKRAPRSANVLLVILGLLVVAAMVLGPLLSLLR
jgi:hypothetical protein